MENEKTLNTVPTVDNDIVEIKLPETVKKLRIDGKVFYFNTDSIQLLRDIEKLGEEVRTLESDTNMENMQKFTVIVDKCRKGIDLALGNGTFVEIFGDNMDSYLRPVYLLSQLVSICRQATQDFVEFEYSSGDNVRE
ncbi:MAG: hypothetical protein IKP07_04165 [Bacilli bacterium]|jgi:hypothetical protein|nr:hypothetical protein [Bacilli bacterium]